MLKGLLLEILQTDLAHIFTVSYILLHYIYEILTKFLNRAVNVSETLVIYNFTDI